MDLLNELAKGGILPAIIAVLFVALYLVYVDNKQLQENYRRDLKEINDKWSEPIKAIRMMVESMFNNQAKK